MKLLDHKGLSLQIMQQSGVTLTRGFCGPLQEWLTACVVGWLCSTT